MHKYSSSQSNTEMPRGLKRRPVKKRTIVNLENTRYPIVATMCKQLNYQLLYDRESSQWDIFWSDSTVTIDFVAQMNVKQKVNHFSAMSQLSRKALLATNLKRMQKAFPESYSFFPLTFILPQDVQILKKYQERMKLKGNRPTFIIKPEVGCQGRGIYLWQDKIQLQARKEIVQVYLQRPLLFKGLKFDMRVYALVTSCAPLRAYIYNQGLVRCATEPYQRPTRHNIQQLRMHLTNYAINRQSPKYIFNDSLDDLSKGHKKSLAEFFQTMKVMGLPAQQYWTSIKDITVKTLIAGLPWLQKQMQIAQPDHLTNNFCFQILGLDFILEDNNKVYLLQVNHTPSFFTDTPLDEHLKSNLIRDTLQLVSKEYKIIKRSPERGLSSTIDDERNLQYSGVFSKSQEVRYQSDEYLMNGKYLGSYEQIHPSPKQNIQQKYHNLISYTFNSISFNAPPRRKSVTYQTPSRKRINSEPRCITPVQQFSHAPKDRERFKVSKVLKPEPIKRSQTKRVYNTVFDRQQFREQINRRNHPLRRKKIKQSQDEYQVYKQDDLHNSAGLQDIIEYHRVQKQPKYKKEQRQEVHYPYY